MLVKSIDVPLVDATAVPDVKGYNAPVVPVTKPVDVMAPADTVPANVVFRPVLIVIASEPPIWMAPDPSVFPFSPIGI
jgi:hypothetical protein